MNRLKHLTLARLAMVGSLFLVLSSCAGGNPTPVLQAQHVGEKNIAHTGATSPSSTGYVLGAGDKLKLTVYGEPDMSGEFVVDGNGALSLPLVGQVKAGGLTVPQFETSLSEALSKYLRSPQVSAQVLNFRPFYIQGEIKAGGEYPYSSGLVVRDAIAKAGGYTYRAVTGYVYIRHANETVEREYSLDGPVPVQPGDNIRVPERIF